MTPENGSLIRRMFDAVYVVSLPASSDRRTYVSDHLRAHGVTDFAFHDACPADDPRVADAYASGRVMTFPPCFRCGGKRCQDDSCNNVLIAPQVATFITYLQLWERIAASAQRALVVEDDVVLHDWWPQTLAQLATRIEAGQLRFQPDHPTLLRLGWALGSEHRADGPFVLDSVLRMSNPCHALTSAMAANLLTRFEKINTTVDVFQHREACREGEGFTVRPPIASELSWSTGAFASLIHPKEVRTQFLEANGQAAAAEQNRKTIQDHIKHIYHRPFLVVGHPRTGTGYAASLMRQMGLDIGHERDGADGLSSWMFAVEADDNPYAQAPVARTRKALHWDHLVQVVRDLATAVPSVMRDDQWAPPSREFRRDHILRVRGVDLNVLATPFERAVRSITEWARIIADMKPHHVLRIEDGASSLRGFIAARTGRSLPEGELDLSPVNADKLYKGVQHAKPVIGPADWQGLSEATRAEVRWYCATYGYALPQGLNTRPGENLDWAAEVDGLYRQFLKPSGWINAKQQQRPIGHDGRPVPWFTYGAIEFLSRIVRPHWRVFEYGAGYSTLWWQEAVASVTSVDHDAAWVAELRPQLHANASLTLLEADAPVPADAAPITDRFFTRPRRREWSYDAARVVRRGLDDEGFQGYAAHILDGGQRYDAVIIDGMARRLCAEFAVEAVADTGLIVLDNSNRSDYDAAFDILNERGFRQIPFWGLVPGANFLTCTSFFVRSMDVLPDGRHGPNTLGLPEY